MNSPRVAVIDYGIGNLRSAEKAVQRAGADAFLTSDPFAIEKADAVVLPGVGAMARCMDSLRAYGLHNVTVDAIHSGRPFLGVCVGMQMLHAGSIEHGGVEGLGAFAAQIVAIQPKDTTFKVPHMQWNRLDACKPSRLLDPLYSQIGAAWMYFVHSFAPELHEDVVATADYGGPVGAVVERGTVMGTQFHPEKSGAHGLALLKEFLNLIPHATK